MSTKKDKKRAKKESKKSAYLGSILHGKNGIKNDSEARFANPEAVSCPVNLSKNAQQKNTTGTVEKKHKKNKAPEGVEPTYEEGLANFLYSEPVDDRCKEVDERKTIRVNKDGTLSGKRGPKVKFSDEQIKATEMLAKLGATNAQLSTYFNVDISTIVRWIQKYKIFRDARKRGGMDADMKVVDALFQRATGYDYDEQELKFINNQWTTVQVRKHVPPDAKLIVFWLSKRQREQWAITKQVEVGGTVTHQHKGIEDLDTSVLTKKTQKMLYEIANEQLAEGGRDN
jgi:hypothetical protein